MEQLPKELVNYLKEKGIPSCEGGDLVRLVIRILEEKDQTISNLQQQITKYKCQDIKNQKLIKTLQDKLTQLAPSISDTGSHFMMASQFKANFEELITTAAPSALADVVHRPFLFSKCLYDIVAHTQQDLQAKISQIVTIVYDNLHISVDICSMQAAKGKIRLSLLRIFQQFWESMLPFESHIQLKYSGTRSEQQLTEQLNEIVSSDDYLELRKQLHKIVAYMLLQQKEWEFVGLNCGSTIKYSKKQHTCLDGWIKEGEQALVVLQGLRRDGHLHPNLKNYVIPFFEGDSPELFARLSLKPVPKELEAADAKSSGILLDAASKCQRLDEITNIISNCEEQVSLLVRNKSEQMFKQQRSLKQNKENTLNYANKKPKKKEKLTKPSLESSLKAERSPKSRRKHDDSVRTKKLQSQEHLDYIEDKIQLLKQEMFSKKKNSTTVINKNISNSHDIIFQDLSMLPLKRRPLQELPVSKELPLRKKTKPATSRKNSVGKIVSQHHIIGQKQAKEKENCPNYANGKAKAKEKVYKDIIKEKLIEDKGGEKAQLSLSLLHAKAKTDRQRRQEENRPLKIQGNANKLRQKYMS